MQFKFSMKEIIIGHRNYFNWHCTLQMLIPPYHKYWMPDLEMPPFLNTKLDRNNAISIFIAHSWIREYSMRKYYVSLMSTKSKIK